MSRKKVSQLQQGDVLLARATLPAGAKKRLPEARGYVLAEGEATGHAHCIEATEQCEMYEKDGQLFIHVNGPESVDLVHEEHGTVTIPEGDWKIGAVQEVDHFEDEIRSVRD